MIIAIDHDKCIGAGQCALVAPDRFDQGDDGTVVLLDDGPVTDDERAEVESAVTFCPSGALSLQQESASHD